MVTKNIPRFLFGLAIAISAAGCRQSYRDGLVVSSKAQTISTHAAATGGWTREDVIQAIERECGWADHTRMVYQRQLRALWPEDDKLPKSQWRRVDEKARIIQATALYKYYFLLAMCNIDSDVPQHLGEVLSFRMPGLANAVDALNGRERPWEQFYQDAGSADVTMDKPWTWSRVGCLLEATQRAMRHVVGEGEVPQLGRTPRGAETKDGSSIHHSKAK